MLPTKHKASGGTQRQRGLPSSALPTYIPVEWSASLCLPSPPPGWIALHKELSPYRALTLATLQCPPPAWSHTEVVTRWPTEDTFSATPGFSRIHPPEFIHLALAYRGFRGNHHATGQIWKGCRWAQSLLPLLILPQVQGLLLASAPPTKAGEVLIPLNLVGVGVDILVSLFFLERKLIFVMH